VSCGFRRRLKSSHVKNELNFCRAEIDSTCRYTSALRNEIVQNKNGTWQSLMAYNPVVKKTSFEYIGWRSVSPEPYQRTCHLDISEVVPPLRKNEDTMSSPPFNGMFDTGYVLAMQVCRSQIWSATSNRSAIAPSATKAIMT